jgi:uncharacterized protein HemX
MFGIPFSLAFLSPVLGFLKAIPAKVWLILFLVLLYPVLYMYGHHKGVLQGEIKQQIEYQKASKKAEEEQKKQHDKDAKNALDEQTKLVKQLDQLQSSKDQLQKRLNELSKNKPVVDTCPKLPAERVRSLKADIDKANN